MTTKKIIIGATIVLLGTFADLQAQNSFPTGVGTNVGLGILQATSRLHVASGDVKIDTGKLLIGPATSTIDNFGIESQRAIRVNSTSTDLAPYSSSIGVNYTGTSGVNSIIEMSVTKVASTSNGSLNAIAGDVVMQGSSAGSFIISNRNLGDIKFETTSGPYASRINMRIDKTGNVGIGTGSSPLAANEKLAVNGQVHAKEVKVDLVGWPDYVFAKNFKLPSLIEIEKEIKATGHLPNTPSAKTIEANGLCLGEISKIQQEKIEELMLYVIEQNKINEKQTREIEQLKALVKTIVKKK